MLFYRQESVFPKLLTIAKVDKVKAILVVVFQSMQVVRFAEHKIISPITASLVLVGKDDELACLYFERNYKAFLFVAFQYAVQQVA